MRQELGLSLTRPGGESVSRLWIEQQEYGQADGFLSRAGMLHAFMVLLDGSVVDRPICADDCSSAVFVYRDDLSLNYRLHTSHGSLGDRVAEEVVYREKLEFSMDDTASLKYPNFGLVSADWLGGRVWGRDGMEIGPTALDIGPAEVRAAQKLYGTLEVAYRVRRDRYSLSLPRREESVENHYSAVVYALHRGGPTWISVKPPPGAEETGQQCTGGGGGGVTITPPDDPDEPPTSPHADARIVTDYCSQEVTLDTTK